MHLLQLKYIGILLLPGFDLFIIDKLHCGLHTKYDNAIYMDYVPLRMVFMDNALSCLDGPNCTLP